MVRSYLAPERPFSLRPSIIKALHQAAVEGIEPDAGRYRRGAVGMTKSKHVPPPAHLVAELVEGMCDYVNANWHETTAFHLAAYVMWRVNWIHAFTEGNGRTSRAVSYLVLSVRTGYELPGHPMIPQQIERSRRAYFEALEAADAAWADSGGEAVDVAKMESLLKGMLAQQLLSVIDRAGGSTR